MFQVDVAVQFPVYVFLGRHVRRQGHFLQRILSPVWVLNKLDNTERPTTKFFDCLKLVQRIGNLRTHQTFFRKHYRAVLRHNFPAFLI